MTDPRLVRMDAERVERLYRSCDDPELLTEIRIAYSEGITEAEGHELLASAVAAYGEDDPIEGPAIVKLRAAFTQEESDAELDRRLDLEDAETARNLEDDG